jgi:predicted esterase
MTREDRELAIADNVAYVRGVVNEVRGREGGTGLTHLPLIFAGFSQGAAMAFRAAANVASTGVIALGGDIPPDVRAAEAPLPSVLLGRGTQDAWYTHEQFEADAGWLRATGTDADVFEFDGGHEWAGAFRDRSAEFLDRAIGGGSRPRRV